MQTDTTTKSEFKAVRPEGGDVREYVVIEKWQRLKARWFSREVYWKDERRIITNTLSHTEAHNVADALNGEAVNPLQAMDLYSDSQFGVRGQLWTMKPSFAYRMRRY